MIKITQNQESYSYLLEISPDKVISTKIIGITVQKYSLGNEEKIVQYAEYIKEFGDLFIFQQANVVLASSVPETLHGKLTNILSWSDKKHTYYFLNGVDQLMVMFHTIWNWDMDDCIIPYKEMADLGKSIDFYQENSSIIFACNLDFYFEAFTSKYSYAELETIAKKVNKKYHYNESY